MKALLFALVIALIFAQVLASTEEASHNHRGGMFGMGGMGMYGSGMFGLGSAEGEQKGFLTNTLAALHSFGFLIYSLG